MKDPVRVLGLVLLLVIFLGVSYWFVQGELESQEHFTRECRARGGVAITQVSGTRICVSGQEIVIP